MLDGANDARFTIGVQIFPARGLAEGDLGGHATRRCLEEFAHGLGIGAGDIPAVDGIAERFGVNGRAVAVDQATAFKLARMRMMPPARCTSSM